MALAGHVALVTGGAKGIGKAICDALLNEKAKVCITDILEAEGDITLKDFEAKYGKENVIFHKLDVTNENEFESTVLQTKQCFGHLDILCNNAGIMNEAKTKEMVEINVMGVINGIQIAHKYLENCKGEKGGTVINTASVAGINPFYAVPLYSATKQAVVCLTRVWGNEKNVDITKVKVNAVCPDAVSTELLITPANGIHDDLVSQLTRSYEEHWLKPEDIANGVLKILHDKVTGATLVISNVRETCYHTANVKDYMDEMSNV